MKNWSFVDFLSLPFFLSNTLRFVSVAICSVTILLRAAPCMVVKQMRSMIWDVDLWSFSGRGHKNLIFVFVSLLKQIIWDNKTVFEGKFLFFFFFLSSPFFLFVCLSFFWGGGVVSWLMPPYLACNILTLRLVSSLLLSSLLWMLLASYLLKYHNWAGKRCSSCWSQLETIVTRLALFIVI